MAVKYAKDQPAGLANRIERVAIVVPYVMPNCYGSDITDVKLQHESMVGTTVLANIAHVEKLGVSSWIALVTGSWYDICLVAGKEWFGLDPASKTWTFYNDGKGRVSLSTLPQCGRAVAGMLSLKELPKDDECIYQDKLGIEEEDLDSITRICKQRLDDGWTMADWSNQ